MNLQQLGWNGFFEAEWNSRDRGGEQATRVIAEQRGMWHVAGEFGEAAAEASGKLRARAEEGDNWPAVGDWMSVEGNPRTGFAINEVLPRRTAMVRKMTGKRLEQQVLAANIDVAFLVMALDNDYNPRRMERYLAQVWDCGARPVILLNKMDLCAEADARVEEIERAAMGAPVSAVSAATGEGMSGLESQLKRGETAVLLGSSGVGKSSLVNRLLGSELQRVHEVRQHDGRGRHTTTQRQLLFTSSGAMIIDTPGLRELQLWDAQQGLEQAFAEIEELGGVCKFRDCTHRGEPGCAVEVAIQEGRVERDRLESHRKLQRELDFLKRKIDAGARQKEKQRIKTLHRAARDFYRQHDRSEDK
ncbi:MAG TPA: ribosome small subunit-dependent GTPase A [Candidatus Acidoferrum sp.]